jgi:hypothetical protein
MPTYLTLRRPGVAVRSTELSSGALHWLVIAVLAVITYIVIYYFTTMTLQGIAGPANQTGCIILRLGNFAD